MKVKQVVKASLSISMAHKWQRQKHNEELYIMWNYVKWGSEIEPEMLIYNSSLIAIKRRATERVVKETI